MPRHNSEYAAGWLNRSFTSIGIPPLPGREREAAKERRGRRRKGLDGEVRHFLDGAFSRNLHRLGNRFKFKFRLFSNVQRKKRRFFYCTFIQNKYII